MDSQKVAPEGAPSATPLSGLRVVDLTTWIGGAYCTKLLADGGADVVKVEAPEGDPLRRWSASGAAISPNADGALFNFLGTSKQSVVVDGDDEPALAAVHGLLASADAVVWSPGSQVADDATLAPPEILRRHPHLVVASITPFGLDGPWSDKAATEFTLQAWSGGIVGLARGRPERAPVFVGGQIGEWLSGLFAAIGTLAALRRHGSEGELIDVSMLEALAMCLTYYPVTFNDQLGRPMRKRRFVPTPGVGAARDGLVGLGCGTGQQWLDFCVMVEHPEWMEDPKLFLDRTALAPTIDAWVAARSVDEVLDSASAFRIPNAPIANGVEHCDLRALPRAGGRSSAIRGTAPPIRGRLSGWGLHLSGLRSRRPGWDPHSIEGVCAGRGPRGSSLPEADRFLGRTPVPRLARVGHDRLLGGSAGRPCAGPPWSGGDPPRVAEPA